MNFEHQIIKPLQVDLSDSKVPELFTFPFYYKPHPLSILAAQALQNYLASQEALKSYYGVIPGGRLEQVGKMFGVLVVQQPSGDLGYLAAFSGKLMDRNDYPGFVPAVFDRLSKGSFFLKGEEALNQLNRDIETLEKHPELINRSNQLTNIKNQAEQEIRACKTRIKLEKQKRKKRRDDGLTNLSPEDFQALEEALRQESLKQQYYLKDLKRQWQSQIDSSQKLLNQLTAKISELKIRRKQKSATLQKQLFNQYKFLNGEGNWKSLWDIFGKSIPPAGAGACAAPKLLQYAFEKDLRPVAMAEFWWGRSPKSEVRKHLQFYPACRGKCEPILGHMLEGIPTETNPFLKISGAHKTVAILYEDNDLAVINKPFDFLSVPGKNIRESVFSRMEARYPEATGPLIVHRLDWSTSGIMVIAKHKDVHKKLQVQFAKRTIKKRYVAILDGSLKEDSGTIDLPLRVDLDNRPMQLVCNEHGKSARTHWKVISRDKNRTRIHFFPVTGRTHQLRVHAAHSLGLGIPILGDDLYGNRSERLFLHAEWIELEHPGTGETIAFEDKAPF